jgi:hypothetical protein
MCREHCSASAASNAVPRRPCPARAAAVGGARRWARTNLRCRSRCGTLRAPTGTARRQALDPRRGERAAIGPDRFGGEGPARLGRVIYQVAADLAGPVRDAVRRRGRVGGEQEPRGLDRMRGEDEDPPHRPTSLPSGRLKRIATIRQSEPASCQSKWTVASAALDLRSEPRRACTQCVSRDDIIARIRAREEYIARLGRARSNSSAPGLAMSSATTATSTSSSTVRRSSITDSHI